MPRLLISLAAIGGFIAVMYAFLWKPPADSSGPTSPAGAAVDAARSSVARQCEDELARLIEAMQPERLGILGEAQTVTDELNAWVRSCGGAEDLSQLTQDDALRQELLGDAVDNPRFTPADVLYVRECLLAQTIVEALVPGKKSELERILAIFDFTQRTIVLTPPDDARLPLSPYEALLFGRGSAAARAWTFASLLRQLRLDAVLVRSGDPTSGPWLVGVIDSRQNILLFDAELGLPIPVRSTVGADLKSMSPATLAQAREEDAVFRAFDLPNDPYPWNSDLLKNAEIQLIGVRQTWLPKTARLQFLLPARYNVALYDGLGINQLRRPGLHERVETAAQAQLGAAPRISVWTTPEQVFTAVAGGRPPAALVEELRVFHGPYVVRQDPRSGELYEQPFDRSLQVVRIEQLQGEHAVALRQLLPIRTSERMSPLPANQQAANYAGIWSGVAQYESGRYAEALNTFRRYLEAHSDHTGWNRSAYEWSARCYVQGGKFAAAADQLTAAPAGPAPRRDALLIRAWRAAANPAAPDEPAKNDAEAPAESPGAKAPESEPNAAPAQTSPSDEAPATPSPSPASVPDAAAPEETSESPSTEETDPSAM